MAVIFYLPRSQFWCEVCERTPECMSHAPMRLSVQFTGEGFVLFRVECHGQTADFALSIEDIQRIRDQDILIPLFGEDGVRLPFTPTPLPEGHEQLTIRETPERD